MKKYILLLLLVQMQSYTQSIRKNYTEMLPIERQYYVDALLRLNSDGVIPAFTSNHNTYAMMSHGTEDFLPWHRAMIDYFEDALHTRNKYLTLCYYDNGISSRDLLFSNGLGGSSGLLGFNPMAALGYTRYGNFSYSNMAARKNTVFNQSGRYDEFRPLLESDPHNNLHISIAGSYRQPAPTSVIGPGGIVITLPPMPPGAPVFGSMSNSTASPQDPVFYFHHAMVDKWWNDWLKTLWTGSDYGAVNNNPLPVVNGYPTYKGYEYFDSRALKLWYAENKKVVLDNYMATNQTLGVATGQEFYFYTDTIHVSSTPTLPFIVPFGKDVKIESMTTIALLPGFGAEDGSTFGSEIISTFPSNNLRTEALEDKNIPSADSLSFKITKSEMKVYPNPNKGIFTIAFTDAEDTINEIQIIDVESKMVSFLQTENEISISNQKGTYTLIVFTTKGKKYFSRIIVD